jgi:hypothetical protein
VLKLTNPIGSKVFRLRLRFSSGFGFVAVAGTTLGLELTTGAGLANEFEIGLIIGGSMLIWMELGL